MPNLTSASDPTRFFINDFDAEDFDQLLINVVDAIYDENSSVLEFWVNSEGGDASRAFALVELIRLAEKQGLVVETFVLSQAFSAGSVVAVAGSPNNRWVARDATYMLHYGTAETMANSHVSAQRIMTAHTQHFLMVLNHYEKYTDIPDLEEKMKFDDLYITGEQAVAWGLADHFLDEYGEDN